MRDSPLGTRPRDRVVRIRPEERARGIVGRCYGSQVRCENTRGLECRTLLIVLEAPLQPRLIAEGIEVHPEVGN